MIVWRIRLNFLKVCLHIRRDLGWKSTILRVSVHGRDDLQRYSNRMKACANGSIQRQYFLTWTTSTDYLWASEVFKNQSLKSQFSYQLHKHVYLLNPIGGRVHGAVGSHRRLLWKNCDYEAWNCNIVVKQPFTLTHFILSSF